MIGVNFDKATAGYFIDCLAEGRSIEHGPWTIDDMVMLAGACFFAVRSHGPWRDRIAKLVGGELPRDLHPELEEAVDETLTTDLHGAIEFCAELTMRIVDGEYDDLYKDHLQAILRADTRQIHPVKGFRQFEP